MQVKIVIGTIAFMVTMIIFGYAALREPARMELYTEMRVARDIEKGADLFHSNCATCHGEHGRAEECYDGDGEQIGCAGRALNYQPLVCGEPSQRMNEFQWLGTKAGFVAGTIAAGRPQNGMPTWGVEYGGSLETYEVNYITSYVLNWETDELCSAPTPEPVSWPATVAELPVGNAENGEQLYNIDYGCSACHGDLDVEGSNAVGPWAGEFKNLDEVRVAGYAAADYLYESILLPSAYISPECPTGPCAGPPSSMPDNFGTRMSLQDMADVMAFLLETPEFSSSGVEVQYP